MTGAQRMAYRRGLTRNQRPNTRDRQCLLASGARLCASHVRCNRKELAGSSRSALSSRPCRGPTCASDEAILLALLLSSPGVPFAGENPVSGSLSAISGDHAGSNGIARLMPRSSGRRLRAPTNSPLRSARARRWKPLRSWNPWRTWASGRLSRERMSPRARRARVRHARVSTMNASCSNETASCCFATKVPRGSCTWRTAHSSRRGSRTDPRSHLVKCLD